MKPPQKKRITYVKIEKIMYKKMSLHCDILCRSSGALAELGNKDFGDEEGCNNGSKHVLRYTGNHRA